MTPAGGRASCVEGYVEKPRISYVFPTPSDENAGILRCPQMEEGSKFLSAIGESRVLNIFTLSTTTNFLFKLVSLYLGTVHNQAHTDAVEAR